MSGSALRLRFSKSLASRRHRLSRAKNRPMTQRRGKTLKPFAVPGGLTIFTESRGSSLTSSEKRLQEPERPEQGRQNQDATIAILNVGRVNHGMREQAPDIDQDVVLFPTASLLRIIPRPPRLAGGIIGSTCAHSSKDSKSFRTDTEAKSTAKLAACRHVLLRQFHQSSYLNQRRSRAQQV